MEEVKEEVDLKDEAEDESELPDDMIDEGVIVANMTGKFWSKNFNIKNHGREKKNTYLDIQMLSILEEKK